MLHYVMEDQNLLSGGMRIQILQEALIKGNPLLAICLHLRDEM